jgi:hypothetical protein
MTTLEFIPVRQVQRRLSEGWQIFSYDPRDYAAVMYAPEGWKPQLLDDKKLYRTCSIEGCNSKHRGRGFCKIHHERFMRHGDPFIVKSTPKIGCTEAGCRNKHKGQGLCATHLERARRAKNTAIECRASA